MMIFAGGRITIWSFVSAHFWGNVCLIGDKIIKYCNRLNKNSKDCISNIFLMLKSTHRSTHLARSAASLGSTGMFAIFFGWKPISVSLATVEFLDDAEAVFVGVIHRRLGHRVVEMRISGSREILVQTITRSADPL